MSLKNAEYIKNIMILFYFKSKFQIKYYLLRVRQRNYMNAIGGNCNFHILCSLVCNVVNNYLVNIFLKENTVENLYYTLLYNEILYITNNFSNLSNKFWYKEAVEFHIE